MNLSRHHFAFILRSLYACIGVSLCTMGIRASLWASLCCYCKITHCNLVWLVYSLWKIFKMIIVTSVQYYFYWWYPSNIISIVYRQRIGPLCRHVVFLICSFYNRVILNAQSVLYLVSLLIHPSIAISPIHMNLSHNKSMSSDYKCYHLFQKLIL